MAEAPVVNWVVDGSALDRLYVVASDDETFFEYLEETHHYLTKELLGRLLPVHNKGREFSIGEMRQMLDDYDEMRRVSGE